MGMPEVTEGGERAVEPLGARRSWRSKLLELAIWIFAPLTVTAGGFILAVILGAPPWRVIVVAALVALGGGGYFLFRPSAKLRMQHVRAAGLVYVGLAALALQIPQWLPSRDPPSTQITDAALAAAPSDRTLAATPAASPPAMQAATLEADAAAHEPAPAPSNTPAAPNPPPDPAATCNPFQLEWMQAANADYRWLSALHARTPAICRDLRRRLEQRIVDDEQARCREFSDTPSTRGRACNRINSQCIDPAVQLDQLMGRHDVAGVRRFIQQAPAVCVDVVSAAQQYSALPRDQH